MEVIHILGLATLRGVLLLLLCVSCVEPSLHVRKGEVLLTNGTPESYAESLEKVLLQAHPPWGELTSSVKVVVTSDPFWRVSVRGPDGDSRFQIYVYFIRLRNEGRVRATFIFFSFVGADPPDCELVPLGAAVNDVYVEMTRMVRQL